MGFKASRYVSSAALNFCDASSACRCAAPRADGGPSRREPRWFAPGDVGSQLFHGSLGAAIGLDAPMQVLARCANRVRSPRHWRPWHFAGQAHESFAVLFLDARHTLLAFEDLFRGTLTQTGVYSSRCRTRSAS
ncbi:hypothetical protein ABIC46_004469 [Variovorax paradoxus]